MKGAKMAYQKNNQKKNYHKKNYDNSNDKNYHKKKKEFITEEQVVNSSNLGEAFPLSLNAMRSWHSNIKKKFDHLGDDPSDQLEPSSLATAMMDDDFEGLILTLQNQCIIFEKKDNINPSNCFLAAYARIKNNLEKQHIAGVLFNDGFIMLSGIPDYKKTIAELNGGGDELFNEEGFNAFLSEKKRSI